MVVVVVVTVCSRGCPGVHRRPISTHIVHSKWLCCVYCIFSWTPTSSQLEQTLVVTQLPVCQIQEIRKEELHLKDNEALIPVAHFHKMVHNTFDVPFLLKIKDVSNSSTST